MKTQGFADIHQHVLWGLDDGPSTVEQMYAMLEQDAAEGVELVYATSHANQHHWKYGIQLYMARLKEANDYCREHGLKLQVLQGSEILYSDSVPDKLRGGKLLPLGNTNYVLTEFYPGVTFDELSDAADNIYRAGYAPVFAHVERYRCLRWAPAKALRLREEYGIYYQINCGTLLRPHGLAERHFIKRMLEAGGIDAIATDAHNTRTRPVFMKEAVKKLVELYGADEAQRITQFGWQLAETDDPGN